MVEGGDQQTLGEVAAHAKDDQRAGVGGRECIFRLVHHHMKTLSRFAFVILALAIATSVASADTRAIRFGQLWDGTRLIKDAIVLVEDDRIVEVRSGAPPRGVDVVDLRRYTGLPGLIDLHTHITYYWDRTPGTRPRGQRRLPAVTVFLAQDNARRTLETGVTTVRDLNASADTDFAMRELTRTGAMIGPRIIASGPGLSARQGAAPDPDAMRKLVEDRVKAGADWIKVFGSRGGFENVDGTQTVTFDEMKAIVDTRARARQEGGDSLVRRVRRPRCRSRRRRFDRARRGRGRRDAGRDGEARNGVGADGRSQPLLHRCEGRVRLCARLRDGAAELHRSEFRRREARRSKPASVSAWARTPCIRCSARTRASSDGSSRPA